MTQSIPSVRYDRAINYMYDAAERPFAGMGLAMSQAASAYQIPRGWLAQELRRRKRARAAVAADAAARAQVRAAGMWWNE